MRQLELPSSNAGRVAVPIPDSLANAGTCEKDRSFPGVEADEAHEMVTSTPGPQQLPNATYFSLCLNFEVCSKCLQPDFEHDEQRAMDKDEESTNRR
jgi:hypothetical protein